MAPRKTVRMTRESLNKAFSKFMSRHHRADAGEEAYDFNIKIQKINIPEVVRKLKGDQDVEDQADREIQDRLINFASSLEAMYPWISGWGQFGHSGGWLTLMTDEPVLTGNEEVPLEPHHEGAPKGWMPNAAIKPAMKRLSDLQDIAELVRKGVRTLKNDLEGPEYWEITPKDWVPEKRRPNMGGPFDFLKFRKEPERRDMIPVVPVDAPRGGGLIQPGSADPFEILAPSPKSGGLVPAAPAGGASVFDVLSRPAAGPLVPARAPEPPADVAVRWNVFEPPALPTRPPQGERRRINWRLPSAEELMDRLKPATLHRLFSSVRAGRHTGDFKRALRDAAREGGSAGLFLGHLAGAEDLGPLADYFGVPYEVLDTYENRGVVRDAIWDELFFPLFETLTEAFEIAKPEDLPGWFAVDWDAEANMWSLVYMEAP